MPHVIPITDNLAQHAPWLSAAEPLHRQLRPRLPPDYPSHMRLIFSEGVEMAILAEQDAIRAIAVYRVHQTTFQGRRFYIDDLVTDEAHRAQSHGAHILAWCEARARERSCDTLALDSGVQRARAHKFYFTHNLSIVSFSFAKILE